ncbi:MAG TPA: hypothetical protein VI074_04245 [Propionibacteriaceae bacterium]
MEIIRNVIRDIKPEYWVALGAAVSILSLMVAGFSLIYVRRSAKASREQTKQQKQAAKDAAQPMLWVDVRGDDVQGQALVLMLGNSGPSIARNVKVVFDPAPPSTLDIKPILEILKQGIASVPPGRTMQWVLGGPHNTIDSDAHNAYQVRIEAEGPFGLIEPLEYVISVDDLHDSRVAPPGNLHAVAVELHEMTKATKELNEIIRSASLEPA